MGDAAPGLGNHCAVDIFVAEFLERLPCQIFGDRHGWELGSGNHGEVPTGVLCLCLLWRSMGRFVKRSLRESQ